MKRSSRSSKVAHRGGSKVKKSGSKSKRSGSKKSKSGKKLKTKLGPNEAYCVKCRARTTMVGASQHTFKKKGGHTGKMMKGNCNKCGTRVVKIVGG